MRYVIAVTAGMAFASGLTAAQAATGVSSNAIVFVQAAVLQGPASARGLGMTDRLLAVFGEANRKGGIHGRQIELISVDDGYEPSKSIASIRKLIEDDKVLAPIGPVGTQTAVAAQPIVAAAKVPFIAAFTGAMFLPNPKLDTGINIRASYDAETEAWIRHLTADFKIETIAILYQDDAFDRVVLPGFEKAMKTRGLTIVAEGTDGCNTNAINAG
jgi:branched-chain amino acid transport system substrate-binding protein